jgi:hypothetical protein
MELPEYVTIDEAKRVCYELNISDWIEMKEIFKTKPRVKWDARMKPSYA